MLGEGLEVDDAGVGMEKIIDDRSAVGGGEHSTGSVCVNRRRTYFAARHIARVGQSYLINIHLIVVGEWRILASVASGLASRVSRRVQRSKRFWNFRKEPRSA
jgi:hypothetical protein